MVRTMLVKLWPSRAMFAKVMPVLGMLVIGVVAFFVGRSNVVSPAAGQERPTFKDPVRPVSDTSAAQRDVAYIYDNMPITREELGEFLIARFGAERLEFLVNRRIVELACKSRNIVITDAMIEAQLDQDLRGFGAHMTRKDFAQQVLKRFNKSLYEWKEDVIRPKLMLAALVGPTIDVTEKDLREGYEGRYGPKVECRMIVLQDNNQKDQIWKKVAESEAEFQRVATTLNVPQLCPSGGKVPPIHKHFGDANIERAAFNLKVGEVSPLLGMPDKTVIILKCDQHIPADVTKRFEDVRLQLLEEIRNFKLAQKIPEVFADLRKHANPRMLLRPESRQEDLERAVLPEIGGARAPTVPSNKAGG